MRKYLELNKSKDTAKLTIIGTNEDVDRDGDIVRAKGVDIKNFKNNPILLFGHKWTSLPIGKVGKIKKTDDTVIFEDIEFAQTKEAQDIKSLVEGGFLKSVSIGFIPKKSIWLDEQGVNEIKQLDEAWYTKNKSKLNKARRVIWESELLELSLVPIPANPSAQVVFAQKGLDSMCAFKTPSVTEESDEDSILIEIPLEELKNAVRPDVHRNYGKADINTKWDAAKAIQQLRKWASTDGSGNKDKMNWKKYRQGFAWYDANDPERFTAYKLPHHYIEDGKLVVVWRGVVAAMATLLGARGGVEIPAEDKRGVYRHLSKHYKDFDKEPPEYRDYSLEDAVKELDDEHLEEFLKAYDAKELAQFIKNKVDEVESLKGALEEIEKNKNKDYNSNSEPTPSDEVDDSRNVIEIEGVSLEELKALMQNVVIRKN